jgi:hypothetical protein
MGLNDSNVEFQSTTNDTYFIFEIIKPDKISKFFRLKKNETFASLYYNARTKFGQNCKLYTVNNETKTETPLLDCNDVILEKFISNNPKHFPPEKGTKETNAYKLYFYEDYYGESDGSEQSAHYL